MIDAQSLKCQRNAIKCYTTPGMKICISNSTMVLSEISWEATCCQITRSPYNVILIIVIQNIKMVNDNKKIVRNSHGSIGLWCFNATFNNISVLLVEETRVSIEKHRPPASHWQTLSHNVVSSAPRHELDSNSQLKTLIAQ